MEKQTNRRPEAKSPMLQRQQPGQKKTRKPAAAAAAPKKPKRKRNMKEVGQIRRLSALIILAIVVVAIVFVCTQCRASKISHEDILQADAPAATVTEEPTTEPPTEPPVDNHIRVIAVGDNLVQSCVYGSAEEHTIGDEEYNFNYVYDGIRDLIDPEADLRIINQETLICNNPDIEITGSDFNFNSPAAVGDAVMDLGFNVVSYCNNHLLDKGIDGLTSALDYWDDMKTKHSDLLTFGTYRDEADLNNIRIKEIDGLKIAFLAYTENINGYSVPEDSSIRIPLLEEEDLMERQIKEANELADVVIVAAHWGVEDTFEVTDGVRELAQKIIDWGADVIIGNHTHVPQTMEYLTRPDGSQGFVFYCLGNFVSAQTYNINIISEVVDFEMEYDPETGYAAVENVQVRPIITQYDDGMLTNLRLVAYKDYTEELVENHGLPYAMGGDYGVWTQERIQEIIDTAIPKEFQKLD